VQYVRLLIAQRHFAVAICVVALMLKLIVPTGYMIDASRGQFAIIACPGTVSAPVAKDNPGMHAAMPVHGMAADHSAPGGHDAPGGHAKVELPCAFAGLSAAALGAVDPVLLAAFVAFLLLLGYQPRSFPPPVRRTFLRPPLRGPPALL
jgi:hypothetical protein